MLVHSQATTHCYHLGMAKLIEKEIHFLLMLDPKAGTRRQRRALIATMSKRQVNALGELCLNVINGRVKVSQQDKESLKRHAAALRKIADKQYSIAQRRRVITCNLLDSFIVTVLHFLNQVAQHLLGNKDV